MADQVKPAVVLIHGIRTYAKWHDVVRVELEEAGFEVFLTNYGRFDVFRFLLPVNYYRKKASEAVYRQLRDISKIRGNNTYSLIAHSFGTYISSNIILNEFDIKIDKIIFVGSVVQYDFPFEQVSDRFSGEIFNEVGARDPWPVIAESSTTGYGNAGTFGFRRPRVRDRFNNSDHSELLTASHCKNIWIPYLKTGHIKSSEHFKVPYWIKALSLLKLKYILLSVLAFLLVSTVTQKLVSEKSYLNVGLYPGDTGWSLKDNDIAKTVLKKMNETCPFEIVFGKGCRGFFGKYFTQRSWRYVKRYDEKLNDLQFSDEFFGNYIDPEKFWFDLQAKYVECVVIVEEEYFLSLKVGEECKLTSAGAEL